MRFCMTVGARLGKSLGEILDLTQEELLLWAAYFELETKHVA